MSAWKAVQEQQVKWLPGQKNNQVLLHRHRGEQGGSVAGHQPQRGPPPPDRPQGEAGRGCRGRREPFWGPPCTRLLGREEARALGTLSSRPSASSRGRGRACTEIARTAGSAHCSGLSGGRSPLRASSTATAGAGTTG